MCVSIYSIFIFPRSSPVQRATRTANKNAHTGNIRRRQRGHWAKPGDIAQRKHRKRTEGMLHPVRIDRQRATPESRAPQQTDRGKIWTAGPHTTFLQNLAARKKHGLTQFSLATPANPVMADRPARGGLGKATSLHGSPGVTGSTE